MTAPTEQPVAPFDTANGLLADHGAQATCSVVPTSAGQRLALTVRTPSTTLTVFLAKQDAENWAQMISQAALNLSGLIVPGIAQPA
jgi:hypothetical protein